MLAVMSSTSTHYTARIGRHFERCGGEDALKRDVEIVAQRRSVYSDTARHQRLLGLIGFEQLVDEAPMPIQAIHHSASAFLRAVSEPNEPIGAQLDMVAEFLDRLGSNRGEPGIRRAAQLLVEGELDAREKIMPGDRLSEVAIGLFDHETVAELKHVPTEGESVGIPATSFDFRRQFKEQRRLADQVKREVGKAEIDLDGWRMTTPFGQPLAQDQAVVTQAKQVIDQRVVPLHRRRCIEVALVRRSLCSRRDFRLDRGKRRHQMCFTTSGMS